MNIIHLNFLQETYIHGRIYLCDNIRDLINACISTEIYDKFS